jgi:hypothetical protein
MGMSTIHDDFRRLNGMSPLQIRNSFAAADDDGSEQLRRGNL